MRKQSLCYDREKLYEEVWAEPVTAVAKRYGVSDVAIAKTCRKMHIPVPGRGYWNKVQSGQKMKKVPLPTFDKCPKVKRNILIPEAEIENKRMERLVPDAFILERELIKKEALPEMQVTYRPDIKLTNQYVRNTQGKLNESKKKLSYSYYRGLCRSDNDEAFQVSVGPNNIQRVLAILQLLCNALEDRGYPIGPKPKDPKEKQDVQYRYQRSERHPIYIKVLDAYIIFRITEISHKRKIEKVTGKSSSSPYERYEFVPSGKLAFEILNFTYETYARHKWQDGKFLKIEDQMNDFIISMTQLATIEKEKAAQAAVRHRQWQIEEEKRREREMWERIDKARIEHLFKEAERLVKFKQIREYIDVISEEGKRRLGENFPDSDFARWVEWARQFLENNDCRSWKLPKFDLSDQYFFIR